MTREEKIALLVDELEDIRCDNFDADTIEDKTLKETVRVIKVLQQESKTEKCKWIRYDYRTICPKNHDVNNPYWRLPENTKCLKYCPYCGREIVVTE